MVILQTESPIGIANAEAIYSLPGVDAIFVGPVDLRANLVHADGSPATDEELEAALAQVVAIGKKTGTPTGMHTMDPQMALRRAAQGMQFLAIGSELLLLTKAAQEVVRAVRPENAGRDVARY
jgi:4-hydroxy-2-oxoheptanedioate aldolase